MKKYAIKAEEIKDLITPIGGCYATDHIVVDAKEVKYMYREEPDFEHDSGWRFFSGEETQEYVDNADNSAIYQVNTIVNYDSDIIPYLATPAPCEFEKVSGTIKYQKIN